MLILSRKSSNMLNFDVKYVRISLRKPKHIESRCYFKTEIHIIFSNQTFYAMKSSCNGGGENLLKLVKQRDKHWKINAKRLW